MRDAIRVISQDTRKLYPSILLNILHLILKGLPFGILLLVIIELMKPQGQADMVLLAALCAVMIAIMTTDLFLAMRVHTLAYLTAYDLSTQARLFLGDHLRKLSLGFFKKREFGDISALLLQDMAKVESIFSNFFLDAVACFVLPLLMALFFGLINPWLTGVMLLVTVLAIPALIIGQRIIGHLGKRLTQTRNHASVRILEYLHGIKALKAFNLTGTNFKRLDQTMKQLKSDSLRLEVMAGAPLFLYMGILEVGFMAIPLLGLHLLFLGEISREVLLLFMVVGYKFFEPLVNFGAFISEIRFMNIAAGRISEVMDTSPLPEPADPIRPAKHHIEFNHVSFGYTETCVIDQLNLRFPDKSITALVGPSGSGKTTLTNLIARFWDVDQGAVRIGGTDIRDIGTEHLNSMISVVFQDVYLFRDTIRNNIMVGNKNASEADLIHAAKLARCHDFIQALDQGYDTLLDENGANLSGGEKQRISIARAILKDAPIVLLDEATSSLDPENAHFIQEAINAMVASKTLIVIAHTLNTIVGADQIVVMDRGKIAQQGSHEELLQAGGLYKTLWQEQQFARGWKFQGNPVRN